MEDNIAVPFQKDYPDLRQHSPDSPESDQWAMFRYHYQDAIPPEEIFSPEPWRRSTPLSPPSIPVTIQSAEAAHNSVLADVGDNARLDGLGIWIPREALIDRNILDDVTNETGPSQDNQIDHQDDFGGYPVINPGTPYADSDQDGMADEWENLHFRTVARGSTTDSGSDLDGDGYTDLEEFLNGKDPKKTPTAVRSKTETPHRFELSQNYPNLFNALTTIEFSLPRST